MIDKMPRPRPPHLHKETTRHGRTVWYVRVGRGPRVRINEDFGDPGFMVAYNAAIAGEPIPKKATTDAKSLKWLIDRYRESADWLKLSPATKRQRENIFKPIIGAAGHEPFAAITRKTILKGIDRRSGTPFAGRHFLYSMRGLFQWAVKQDHVTADPTKDIVAPTPETEGFAVWSEDEIARFEAHWAVGTRERLALAVFLYTGLRRGDAAKLGRQHVRDGVISVRTEKTGTPVIIPILPALQEIIDQSPIGEMVFLSGERGKPMTKESLGNWFREACDAAGVSKSAHGLRKAGATRAANAGATVAQLEAIFGWEGGKMAAHYTKTADRTRLARDAMGKLAKPKKETPIPAPVKKVRD